MIKKSVIYKVYCGDRFICKTRIIKGLKVCIGLMFKKKLKKESSLLLELPQKQQKKVFIHTFFVLFPLDLFFLDKNLKVIEKTSLRPWQTYKQRKKAKYVLEANKKELRLRINDKLKLCT